MSTVRYTKAELRELKGRVNRAKISSVTEDQIANWKREEGITDDTVGQVRVVPQASDVRALRQRLALSQEEFAERYMLSLQTIQEWELHRRELYESARSTVRNSSRPDRHRQSASS